MFDAILDWLESKPSLRERVTRLESFMATFSDALVELDAATTEVADELAELQGRLAASDSASADALAPVISRLRAMATSETEVDPEGDVSV